MKNYPTTEIFLHIDDEKPVCILETNELRAGAICLNALVKYELKHKINLSKKNVLYITFRYSHLSILMLVILELKTDYIVTIY